MNIFTLSCIEDKHSPTLCRARQMLALCYAVDRALPWCSVDLLWIINASMPPCVPLRVVVRERSRRRGSADAR